MSEPEIKRLCSVLCTFNTYDQQARALAALNPGVSLASSVEFGACFSSLTLQLLVVQGTAGVFGFKKNTENLVINKPRSEWIYYFAVKGPTSTCFMIL